MAVDQPGNPAPVRILIVEDVAADADLMTRELRKALGACTTARAQNEAELVRGLHEFVPDVVLSDHSLPQFTAMDALRVVRRERPGTPVIIVTGSIDEETAADYIKAGAVDYVVKQRLPRLGPAVRRALVLQQALRDAADAEVSRTRSEQRFRALVEHSTDVITLLDADGRIVYSTHSLQPTLGYTPGEKIGHSVFELIHPEDRQAAEPLFREVLQVPSRAARADLRVQHKDGSWRHLEVVAVNRLDDTAIRAIVVNYHDVTERKRLEQQVLQAQKMEAVGQLAGGVAHDFNNLLTVILGSTDLLLEALPSDHPAREEALETRKAALRAADLTRQLLAFSRQQVWEPQVLSLNDIVASMDRMLQRLIGEDVELRTVLAEDLGAVRADPGQLEQVIVNLAVNARDAMPKAGTLTIETANVTLHEALATAHTVVVPGAYVMLAVNDTRTGMAAETQARVFEPFFTTKLKGKGTGLGLAIVYGIVKQSGGYVWVESEPGRGTTFKIYLPRTDASVARAGRDPVIPASLQGSETILLVEDQEEVRRLIRKMLEARGYQVLVAASGEEALRLAGQHAGVIDLLVTDVVMPGMSGREVGVLLAPANPKMRVLYVSGFTDESIAPFLQKPFTTEALARKVREVLDVGG